MLALLATGIHGKIVAQQLGITYSAVRSFKSADAKQKRLAQEAGLDAASRAIAQAGNNGGASAGSPAPSPEADTASARAQALKLLLKRVKAGDKEAAKALLTATKTAGGRNPGEGPGDAAKSFEAMHDDELIERMLVTACTQWGLERIEARLAQLKASGQADAGGASYPMPALLGGEAAPETQAHGAGTSAG